MGMVNQYFFEMQSSLAPISSVNGTDESSAPAKKSKWQDHSELCQGTHIVQTSCFALIADHFGHALDRLGVALRVSQKELTTAHA